MWNFFPAFLDCYKQIFFINLIKSLVFKCFKPSLPQTAKLARACAPRENLFFFVALDFHPESMQRFDLHRRPRPKRATVARVCTRQRPAPEN